MSEKITKSPFVFNEPVVPPIFAGRNKELVFINNALFENNESLVIYGNDAIGKSSIIRTLYNELESNSNQNILPVKINAFDFINAVEKDFLGIATHQICAAIWTRLLKRKYSELIEDTLLNVRGEQFISSEEKAIKRIFRIVTSEKLTGTGTINKEFGGKLYVEGKVSQANEFVSQRKPLAPFEFLHLLDELIDIIKEYKYNSIIVFCDELNHLPEKTNTEILRNYFSIFSSKKIQFMTVVVNPELHNIQDANKLIESFNYSLEIKPFVSSESVRELLSNSIKVGQIKIHFEDGIEDYLFEVTGGHPWWIQKICDDTFKKVSTKNIEIAALFELEESYKLFKDEIRIYIERTKAGLPFRKFDLR